MRLPSEGADREPHHRPFGFGREHRRVRVGPAQIVHARSRVLCGTSKLLVTWLAEFTLRSNSVAVE